MYKQVETHRGVVYPWMIDHVGHMNVQFYTARFDEATWQFLAQLGLSPSFLNRNHRSAVAVEQRTQYKRELVAGSLIHITTELVSLGRSSIRFLHRMYDSETGEEVASSELVGVYFDVDNRSSATLPPSVHHRARDLEAGRTDLLEPGNRPGRFTLHLDGRSGQIGAPRLPGPAPRGQKGTPASGSGRNSCSTPPAVRRTTRIPEGSSPSG